MNETLPKIERRGGRRDHQPGRPRTGRQAITIWIRSDIVERLGPKARSRIRELVEAALGWNVARTKQTRVD